MALHVLPVNDIRLHSESGEICHCNPRIDRSNDEVLVIHNAFDGREMFEEGSDLRDGALPS